MIRKIILFVITDLTLLSCKNDKADDNKTVTINTAKNKNLPIKNKMKLNSGIVKSTLVETKKFYTDIFGFGVTFENEFYITIAYAKQ
jgi:hypothetical protein